MTGAKARENLELTGDVTTHHHDSRYMTAINNIKTDVENLKEEVETEVQNKLAALQKKVEDSLSLYVLKDKLYDLIYPVSSIYYSDGTVDPNTVFSGTWKKLEGKYIRASGTYNGKKLAAMGTSGETNHTLTTKQMPKHSHERGTMNITGSLPIPTHTNRWSWAVTGAFHCDSWNSSRNKNVEGCDFEEDGKWHDITYGWFR